MSRDSKDLIVGLDIGTSKIVALVAELTPEGRVNVIGMGSQESKGLKKGVVVNIEAVSYTHLDVYKRQALPVQPQAGCPPQDLAYPNRRQAAQIRDSRPALAQTQPCLLYTSRCV